ncbi:MAG: hypothetical protein M3Y87_29435 [Myxococcota bacterium]|nr:hypothetical protein [Myxococcota bacterium]
MTKLGASAVRGLGVVGIVAALLGGCAGQGSVAGRARTTLVRQHAEGGAIALHGSVVRAWPDAEITIAGHCGGPARLVERAELDRIVRASATEDTRSAKLGAPAATSVDGSHLYYVCERARASR